MKVYIVSQGCYSDYNIDRIFINKQKAKDYSSWLNNSRIEEYETSDDKENLKSTIIYLCLTVNDKEENVEYWSEQNSGFILRFNDNSKTKEEFTQFSGDEEDFTIFIQRVIYDNNFNDEVYKNKYTKVAYDILPIVKQKLSEGYNKEQINELLKDR